ncbi:MAG: riboflavin synthase, partial [Coriobacteriia bacterium]|nr:riboflavin synthase [Coriobacteriia bacterium]
MFTGLIESEGIITRIERASGGIRLEVYAPEFGRDMAIGDSIAVDGACLTVIKFIRGAFIADVSEETLNRTTLGEMRQGNKVNLERALRLSDRLGGHMVSGHIDGVARLVMRQQA